MNFLKRLISRRRFNTMFGKAQIFLLPTTKNEIVRILSIDGSYQSATYLGDKWSDLAFEYFKVLERAFDILDKSKRVLLLGGGGFAIPKHMLITYPDTSIDVVEIDPAMIEIARRYFYLDKLESLLTQRSEQERLRISNEDARSFILQDHGKYSLIINDLFCTFDCVSEFDSDKAISRIKEMLEDDGVYAINFVHSETIEEACRIYELIGVLRKHFSNVAILYAKDEEFGGADNYIIFATDANHEFEDAIELPESIELPE